MPEIINKNHPLGKYFVLYDKKTNSPILDPCFSEWIIKFVCGHEKAHFSNQYDTGDQYCQECKALRAVSKFQFIGANPQELDYDRPDDIQINLVEWNPEAKQGRYALARARKLSNGKYVARLDYDSAPYYGTFRPEEIDKAGEMKKGEEKQAELATANYNDQKSLTVFEIPEDILKHNPNVVEELKKVLQIPDVKAYKMISRGSKHDGSLIMERSEEIKANSLITPNPTKM